MSLYDKLLNHTTKTNYTTLEKCYEIGKGHKQSYTERTLRQIVEDTANKPYWGRQVIPQYDQDNKYIIGYKTIIKGQTQNKQGQLETVSFKQANLL